tara:strand:+ start:631 stop:786 length:156 start_codon:yes stop_codon:yes gene_type:complete
MRVCLSSQPKRNDLKPRDTADRVACGRAIIVRAAMSAQIRHIAGSGAVTQP